MHYFSAPSGAGKTTIVHHLLGQNLGLEFSISACSRAQRGKEQDGVDYYFLSVDGFKAKIEQGDFLEWEEVYTDHFYGTLKSEIERIWSIGRHVIFDVDVVGGLNLKKIFSDQALAIFVMPPSIDALEERLRSRETETEDRIQLRMKKAHSEIRHSEDFDYVLLNENLQKALQEAENVVSEFISNP